MNKYGTILVVDDNAGIRSALKILLPMHFAEVELIAQTEADLDFCRAKLLQIADSLKLVKVVKKSYLNLTLDHDN